MTFGKDKTGPGRCIRLEKTNAWEKLEIKELVIFKKYKLTDSVK